MCKKPLKKYAAAILLMLLVTRAVPVCGAEAMEEPEWREELAEGPEQPEEYAGGPEQPEEYAGEPEQPEEYAGEPEQPEEFAAGPEEEETLFTELADEIRVSTDETYVIQSAIDRSFVVDIYGGRTANKTKVQLYKANGTEAQLFRFRQNGDGTYTILNPVSGKALDVPGNSQKNSVQLDIYTDNGTAAQKFRVIDNGDGTVTFLNAGSGKAVDVYAGKARNKARVTMYTPNGSKAQKFYLSGTGSQAAAPAEDFSGSYVIKTSLNSSKALDIYGARTSNKANVQIYTANGTKAQIFTIEKSGDYYTVRNVKSGKRLDVAGGKNKSGTNVWQYSANSSDAQLWKIVRNADGTVSFFTKINENLALDVRGGKTANKTNVDIYKANGTAAQKFNLVKTTAGSVGMNAHNMQVLTNIIGAVESGGQIYGNQNYGAAQGKPYTEYSGIEVTVTLGWAQNYGNEGRRLVQLIFDKDPTAFRKLDTDGSIEDMLSEDWVSVKWVPTDTQADNLVKLITSTAGKAAQDELFEELMKEFIAECEEKYTSYVPAVMMYCEIRHLNPTGAARIFNRLGSDYSLDAVMASLKKDQEDTSNNNQVGDALYQSRHEKCREFIEKYAEY